MHFKMTKQQALDAVDWYIRCLEDIQDKRPVRNLDEAKLASDRAMEYLRDVIKRNLTLEEAQAHCQDEATHELDDEDLVVWFDGYTKE